MEILAELRRWRFETWPEAASLQHLRLEAASDSANLMFCQVVPGLEIAPAHWSTLAAPMRSQLQSRLASETDSPPHLDLVSMAEIE